MKCSYCEEGKCERKNENRFDCRGKKEGVHCACKCQMTEEDDEFFKVSSIVLGSASFVGGAIITGVTFGMGAPVGGFLMGAGTSMVSKPFRKDLSDEHLEFSDSVSEALQFGGAGSVITTMGCCAMNPLVAAQVPIAFQLAAGSYTIAHAVKNGFNENPYKH